MAKPLGKLPMSLLITLHLLSAVVWVGGMFFAYMVLRPVAASLLEPPLRLPVWRHCFARFFVWVWAAVVLLPLTGYVMIAMYFGGMACARLHVHLMSGIAWVMIALFLFLYFKPYRGLIRAVETAEWPLAARHLARIRQIVGANLVLGLVTVAIAAGGRFLA